MPQDEASQDGTLQPATTQMTMTMTMTHSDEVTNGSQKPGRTDVSAGVMTPHEKKLLSLHAVLSRQGRLLVLYIKTVRRVTCREKNQQTYAVTNSSEFKEVTWNKTPESSDSVDNMERGFGEKCGRLFYLSGSRLSALESFNSNRWSLMGGYAMLASS